MKKKNKTRSQGPVENLWSLKKTLWPLFYGWGSTASRLEPLRGGSLLFTNKFPEIPRTHFINFGRMKGWVNPGATQLFWTSAETIFIIRLGYKIIMSLGLRCKTLFHVLKKEEIILPIFRKTFCTLELFVFWFNDLFQNLGPRNETENLVWLCTSSFFTRLFSLSLVG